MDSRLARPSRFTFALAWRALLLAAVSFVIVRLLADTHFYATALVVAGIAAILIADVMRLIGRMERSAEPLAFERAAGILNTERAQRQQQMEYLQTLLDTVTAALIVVNADSHVTLANRAARTLAGRSVDRLEDIAAIGGSGARQLLSLRPGAREIVSLAAGRVFVSVSQFSVPGQESRRLLSIQRIAGELDAVELRAWQDLADVLTHEMMNSLTPISSLSESLETMLRKQERTSDPAGDVAGALEAITRRSRGLMDFVARYRAVAELPAPKLQPIRMQEFLGGIDRLLAPVFREQGVAYRSSVSPEDLTCLADPQLLEQAVINLLRNAADAVKGVPEPKIEVTCELRDARMVMSISDNGCGVPEPQREQIFVPFFTTKSGGSGIGLNLTRHVVLGHGGQLEVRANAPRGSVFTVTLPGDR